MFCQIMLHSRCGEVRFSSVALAGVMDSQTLPLDISTMVNMTLEIRRSNLAN